MKNGFKLIPNEKGQKPQYLAYPEKGYNAIYTVKVLRHFLGFSFYSKHSISSVHSDLEAIEMYLKSTQKGYNLVNKKDNPEYFI